MSKIVFTKDQFDKFREEMGADKVDDILAHFGLGPKYTPKPKKKYVCSVCGKQNAYWKEFGADCDAGQNYMALYCPDCGHEEENPKNPQPAKLLTEFGSRLVTLNTGAQGLRGGLRCEVKDAGEEGEPVMDFIASDETVDRYNEVIKVDAWQTANFMANPVIPDCHDYSSIARILGRARSIGVAEGKLVNRVEFALDNPLGNLAYKMAKGGFIKSQSVGFIPLEWTNGTKDEPARTYTQCELLEISLVVVPANPGATIGLALKSQAIEKRDLSDLYEFLKQFCSDDDSAARQAAEVEREEHQRFMKLLHATGDALGIRN